MANRDAREPARQASAAAANSASPPGGKAGGGWKRGLLTFAASLLVVWGVGAYAVVYFFPRLLYNGLEKSVVAHGIGGPDSAGIPVNSLYAMPGLATPSQSKSLESTGNRDTLYTVGWLDLSRGPQVLHVPDMAGRYYSVQLTDPWGIDFAYVGRRTTGTRAGDYVISGPGWKGALPRGVTGQIVSPSNTVLVIGRTLVESASDVATAYGLASQIRVTPLSQWRPSG